MRDFIDIQKIGDGLRSRWIPTSESGEYCEGAIIRGTEKRA